MDAEYVYLQICIERVTSHHGSRRHAMFRITRGISIDHAPAYPSPALRFPDSTPIRIYAEDERAPQPDDPAKEEEQQKS